MKRFPRKVSRSKASGGGSISGQPLEKAVARIRAALQALSRPGSGAHVINKGGTDRKIRCFGAPH
jgi:hypothetical protein